ncbi:hypothetical protein CC79DRAFT_1322184 [Sarocladium strictum]
MAALLFSLVLVAGIFIYQNHGNISKMLFDVFNNGEGENLPAHSRPEEQGSEHQGAEQQRSAQQGDAPQDNGLPENGLQTYELQRYPRRREYEHQEDELQEDEERDNEEQADEIDHHPNNNYPDPFQHLPNELIDRILEYLGSEYFTEDITRLTVCKQWYYCAIRVMFWGITITRVAFPMAIVPDQDGAFFARRKYFWGIHNNLNNYLFTVRLDFDQLFEDWYIKPEDADTGHGIQLVCRRNAELTVFQQRQKDTHRPWQTKERVHHPQGFKEAFRWAQDMLTTYTGHRNVHTLHLRLRDSWGLSARQARTFQKQLQWVLKVCIGIRHLHLSVNGLAQRLNRDGQQPAGRHMSGHLCTAVRDALPRLEVLHYRAHRLCPGIFRIQDFETDLPLGPDMTEKLRMMEEMDEAKMKAGSYISPYPHLREVIITVTIPDKNFRFVRVLHCKNAGQVRDAFDQDDSAEELIRDMKREIVRFAKRMRNPKIVLLRLARLHRSGQVDSDFGDEFNALTGETKRVRVDNWAEFTYEPCEITRGGHRCVLCDPVAGEPGHPDTVVESEDEDEDEDEEMDSDEPELEEMVEDESGDGDEVMSEAVTATENQSWADNEAEYMSWMNAGVQF